MLVEIDADWHVRLTGTVRPVMSGTWAGGRSLGLSS